MPVYEYICQECAGAFEKRLTFNEADHPQECPSCGSKNNKKKLSLFASNSTGSNSAATGSSTSCGGGGRFT